MKSNTYKKKNHDPIESFYRLHVHGSRFGPLLRDGGNLPTDLVPSLCQMEFHRRVLNTYAGRPDMAFPDLHVITKAAEKCAN